MATPPGTVIGNYRLVERIGRGGMGEVFRAQHVRLGSEAAIKLLLPGLIGEDDFLRRFEREATSTAALQHPAILPVWDFGEHEGRPYLIMPLVRGGTLQDVLERGVLALGDILAYLRPVASALDYAHSRGIVHRDVKPVNIMLDQWGRVYLADFGIARALEGSSRLTRSGVIIGTPEYMAPEQGFGRVVPGSDQYAVGIILYQLLAGRVPFTADTPLAVMMQHAQAPLPLAPLRRSPAASPAVEAVLLRGLAKEPEARYPSVGAFLDALAATATAAPGAHVADTVPADRSGAPQSARPERPMPALPALASPVPAPAVAGAGLPPADIRAATPGTAARGEVAWPLAAAVVGLVAAVVPIFYLVTGPFGMNLFRRSIADYPALLPTVLLIGALVVVSAARSRSADRPPRSFRRVAVPLPFVVTLAVALAAVLSAAHRYGQFDVPLAVGEVITLHQAAWVAWLDQTAVHSPLAVVVLAGAFGLYIVSTGALLAPARLLPFGKSAGAPPASGLLTVAEYLCLIAAVICAAAYFVVGFLDYWRFVAFDQRRIQQLGWPGTALLVSMAMVLVARLMLRSLPEGWRGGLGWILMLPLAIGLLCVALLGPTY